MNTQKVVSLNSRLESNKDEEEDTAEVCTRIPPRFVNLKQNSPLIAIKVCLPAVSSGIGAFSHVGVYQICTRIRESETKYVKLKSNM